jgi:hypothetical protein
VLYPGFWEKLTLVMPGVPIYMFVVLVPLPSISVLIARAISELAVLATGYEGGMKMKSVASQLFRYVHESDDDVYCMLVIRNMAANLFFTVIAST